MPIRVLIKNESDTETVEIRRVDLSPDGTSQISRTPLRPSEAAWLMMDTGTRLGIMVWRSVKEASGS